MIHFVTHDDLQARAKNRYAGYLEDLERIIVLRTEGGVYCDDSHPFFRILFEKCRGELPPEIAESHCEVGSKPLILVLGLHRTLSSCVLWCLQKLGVYIGKTNNGVEDLRISRACECFLPFGSCDLRGSKETRQEVFLRLIKELAVESGESPFAAKYPLLCAFAEEIAEIWPNLRILNLHRSFEHSVQSLIDRAMTRPVGDSYYATAENCRKHQQFLLDFRDRFLVGRPYETLDVENELLQTPRKAIDWLCERFNLAATEEQRKDAAAYVNPRRAAHTPDRPLNHEPWQDEITILVKSFERPDHCRRLVDSIRRHYPEIELLILDDSETPLVMEDEKIVYIGHDVGLAAGRNYLVDLARTPYVFICDDDTIFTEDTDLEVLLQCLKDKDMDIVSMVVDRIDSRSRVLGERFRFVDATLIHEPQPTKTDGDLEYYDFVPNAFLAKRDSLRQCRFNDRLKMGEHIDFALRAHEQQLKLGQLRTCHVLEDSRDNPPSFGKMRGRARELRNSALATWGRKLGFNTVRYATFRVRNLSCKALPEIPKMIHQIWIGPELIPEEYLNWSGKWQELHPRWGYKLWTDESELLALLWPNVQRYYEKCRTWAQRVELLRSALIYQYGGWYFDLDFEPLRPLDDLSGRGDALLAQETSEHIAGAVFAAVPHHLFWGEYLRRVPEAYDPENILCFASHLVTKIAAGRDDVVVLPAEAFYSVTWRTRDLLRQRRRSAAAYAVHHFAASWLNSPQSPPHEEVPAVWNCPARSRQIASVTNQACGHRGEQAGVWMCHEKEALCVLRPCRKSKPRFHICSRCEELPRLHGKTFSEKI